MYIVLTSTSNFLTVASYANHSGIVVVRPHPYGYRPFIFPGDRDRGFSLLYLSMAVRGDEFQPLFIM